jgi:hypothetical protein
LIAVAFAVSSFDMAYLIRVLVNFFYAVCTVSLLVIPRYLDIQKQRSGPAETVGSIHVSGLDMDTSNCSGSSSTSENLTGSPGSRTNLNKATPVSSLPVITENTSTTEQD